MKVEQNISRQMFLKTSLANRGFSIKSSGVLGSSQAFFCCLRTSSFIFYLRQL
jgi:hypothetical protein